jgi:hypothetical protein
MLFKNTTLCVAVSFFSMATKSLWAGRKFWAGRKYSIV